MKTHKYIGYPIDPKSGKPNRSEPMTHVIGGPLTGAAFSDAVRQSVCKKCKAAAGFHCQTPRGRKTWPPHVERLLGLKTKGM